MQIEALRVPLPYAGTIAKINEFVRQIIKGAEFYEQRTGQYLFNHLPNHIGGRVAGTSFDPFHKELSDREIYEWIDNHLVFDGFEIVGLFHGEVVLWEKN